MKMARIIICILGMAVLLGPFVRGQGEGGGDRTEQTSDTQLWSVEVALYRVTGEIRGEMVPEPPVLEPGTTPSFAEGFFPFESAKLMIGDRLFVADGESWAWDGKPLRPGQAGRADRATTAGMTEASDNERNETTSEMKLLASPRIVIRSGDPGTLFVGSHHPVAYYEPRPDGLFERKVDYTELGIKVTLKLRKDKPGIVMLEELRIELSSVVGRQPLPNSELKEGPPIIELREYSLQLPIRQDKDYGILIKPQGKPREPAAHDTKGALMLRLHVTAIGDDEL